MMQGGRALKPLVGVGVVVGSLFWAAAALAGAPKATITARAAPVQAAVVPPASSAAELPGVTDSVLAQSWHDGAGKSDDTINCITQQSEQLGTSYTGWYGDPSTPPAVNTVYYVRVWWGVTGDPCTGGARVAPELFLPAGTTLAISNVNPVRCYAATIPPPNQAWSWAPETASCPQAPQLGVRGGLGFYPVGHNYVTWPTGQGTAWQIQIPVLSTAPLNGLITAQPPQVCPSCLVGAVWLIDGVASPWEYPVQGIPVTGPATPTITYPTPSATNITTTTASGSATLNRAGTTGYVFVEASETPPGGSTCVQSSNQFTIGASSPNSVPLAVSWSALTPGTTYYWRLCYVSNGVTYWGTNQTFTTQGTPKPRILAFSPELGLPVNNKAVVVNGSGLNGATDVKLNGASVSFTPDATDPTHSLSFALPSNATTGFITVTTPGGTATSTQKFYVGIDTYIDSAVVSDLDNGGQADDVRIDFHASEPIPWAQFECALDPDPNDPPVASSCDAGVKFYYNLSPGTHTVSVTGYVAGFARDATPATKSFTYSTGDTTPPDTTITSGPADMSWVTSTAVSFSFASSEQGSSFECRTASNQIWISCTSPATYSGLSQGWHYFYVRARDTSNNADPTPAIRSYDVDTIPPDTGIYSGPAAGSYVASTSAAFAFLAINGSSKFECKLDGAASFSICPQPATYTGLAQGAHTLSVRNRDLAGNVDPTPATRSWTVDTVAPVPQPPTAAPAMNAQAPTTGTVVPIRLRWPAATDASPIDHYDLLQSLNAGSYSVVATVGGTVLTKDFSLTPGSVYRFRVRAVDRAGNPAASTSCPPFSVDVYQESAAQISYAQAWTPTTDASAWGGARSITSAAGAAASLSVPVGTTAVGWVGTLVTNGGQANVYVDGVKLSTVNLASATGTPRRVLFTRTGLDPLVGHVLKVERASTSPAGSTIDVDGLFALR